MNLSKIRKPHTLEEYQENLKQIVIASTEMVNKKLPDILKNVGHALVTDQIIDSYQYVGQIYELTEYLKKLEYKAEQQYSCALLLVEDDELRKEVYANRKMVVDGIVSKTSRLVNLKRAITSLKRSC